MGCEGPNCDKKDRAPGWGDRAVSGDRSRGRYQWKPGEVGEEREGVALRDPKDTEATRRVTESRGQSESLEDNENFEWRYGTEELYQGFIKERGASIDSVQRVQFELAFMDTYVELNEQYKDEKEAQVAFINPNSDFRLIFNKKLREIISDYEIHNK